ncbi:MAG: hypothetical protein ACXVXP_00100 [Mycobacteriaceae bacterium]
MAARVKLHKAAIGAFLKGGQVHALVSTKTNEVADHVKALGIKVGDRDGGPAEYDLPVESGVDTTDRAHGIVRLRHPSGIAVQAKHGALTKAAAAAGLEVKG